MRFLSRRVRPVLAALSLLPLLLLPARLGAQQPVPLPPGGGQVAPLACEEGGNCGTPQNALFVDPKGELEPIRSPGSGSFTRLFTVTRTDGPASQPAFGFSCRGQNGVTCTSFSPSSAVLPLNQPVTVTVTYTTGGPTEDGRVVVGASGGTLNGGTASDSGWVVVPVVSYGVSVTPDGGTQTRGLGDGTTQLFTVQNTGSRPATFTLSCSIDNGAVLGACGAPASTPQLNPGAATTITLTPPALAVGTATITLNATGTNASDAGTLAVTVVRYGVSVTPDGGTVARAVGDGQGQLFTILNTGSANASFALSCAVSNPGVLGSCSVPGSTGLLAPGVSTQVTASAAALAAGSATLTVTATGTNATDGGIVTMEVTRFGVAVTPDGGTQTRGVGDGAAQLFTVQNTGSQPASFTLGCTIDNGAVLGACGAPASTPVLAAGASTTITLTPPALAAGAATITLTATGTNASDAGTLAVTVVRYGVSVTPDGGTLARVVGDAQPHSFTIQNTGSATETFFVECATSNAAVVGACTPSAGTVTLAAGASTTISATAPALATGSATVSLQSANGNTSDTGTLLVTVNRISVAVTPDGGTQTRSTGDAQGAVFTVQNTGTLTTTFDLACSVSAGAVLGSCTRAPAALTLAAGTSGTVTVTAAAQNTGSATVTLVASRDAASDAGTINVTVTQGRLQNTANPRVLVGGAPPSVLKRDSLYELVYDASLVTGGGGTSTATANLECVHGGAIGTCTVRPTQVTLPQGSGTSAWSDEPGALSQAFTVEVVGTASGPGWFDVVATDLNGERSVLPGNVTVALAGLTVTALRPAQTRAPNAAGLVDTFTVQNTGDAAAQVTLQCSGSALITCAAVSPATLTLNAGASATAVVTYATLDELGASPLRLEARSTAAVGTGAATVTISRGALTSTHTVIPQVATAPQRQPGSAAHLETYTVTNTGTASRTFALTCSATGGLVCVEVQPNSLRLPAAGSAVVQVHYRTGAAGTGTLTLTAADAAGSAAGSTTVPVGTAPALGQRAPTLTLVGTPTTTERSLCVTVALAPSAAMECGELRYAFPLPSYRSFGVSRTPTLLYNSAHAHPRPSVQADVVLPRGATIPDSIRVRLIAGTDSSVGWFRAQPLEDGQPRRLRMTLNMDARATGIYPFTLEVASRYGTAVLASSVTGELAVVNRRNTEFGRGWWLAGLERLIPVGGDFLWVGGDGSTRRYRAVAGRTDRWAAESVTEPDTVVSGAGASPGTWARLESGGTRVVFDAQGRHTHTVNRLGRSVRFVYNTTNGRLTSLRTDSLHTVVPAAYTFTYATTGNQRLQSITAPANGATTRTVQVLVDNTSNLLTRFTDVDNTQVNLTYGGLGALLTVERDRRNRATRFVWPANTALLSQVRRDSLATTSRTVTGLEPAERLGIAAAATVVLPRPDSLVTRIDGPRTDVADTTAIAVDRWGAPLRVRDPLGATTRLTRGDARFPGLVTRLQSPDGRVLGMTYDARGNPLTQVDSARVRVVFRNAREEFDRATTRFEHEPAFDQLTKVVGPEGDSTVMAYDAVGQRLWQQDGRGDSTRVLFRYDPVWRQLTSVVTPLTGITDSVLYDVRRNARAVRSPTGYLTTMTLDPIGRVTAMSSPIGAVPTDTTQRLRVFRTYDIRDRLLEERTVGEAASPSFPTDGDPKELRVTTWYSATGTVDSVQRAGTNVAPIKTTYAYDNLDRLVAERHPVPQRNAVDTTRFDIVRRADSTAYDPAGNVIGRRDRRGLWTRVDYDAASRPVRRTTESVAYGAATITDGFGRTRPSPKVSNTQGGGYLVPADTVTMSYDVAGRLLTADNRWARIRRTYSSAGDLETDSIRVATWAGGDFSRHSYGLRHRYDLNGRRTAVEHPEVFRQFSGIGVTPTGRTTYRYLPHGALGTVVDAAGYEFTFRWDREGRLRQLHFPGGLTETREFDAEGRPWRRRTQRGDGSVLLADTLTYDGRGKPVVARTSVDTTVMRYDGLGHLLRSDLGSVAAVPLAYRSRSTEQYAYDAIGNQRSMTRSTEGGMEPAPRFEATTYGYLDSTGVLMQGGGSYAITALGYDLALNQILKQGEGPGWRETVRSFIGGDGKIAATDRFACGINQGDLTRCYDAGDGRRSAFEEYRYDGLGRRILTRTDASDNCVSNCDNTIRRAVWDGDQLLHETRYLAQAGMTVDELEQETGDGVPAGIAYPCTTEIFPPPATCFQDPDPIHRNQYGQVTYTHAGGIDAPLGILRNYARDVQPLVVPHPNWRGAFATGTTATGAVLECPYISAPTPGCLDMDWPAPTQYMYQGLRQRRAAGPQVWLGTLANAGRSTSGQVYLRNRYYDAQTGRFTQADPIGLAGGVNTFGFGNGDPVNFADPFGLCPPEDDDWTTCPGFFTAIGAATGALFGGASGGFGGASAGAAMCAPTIVGSVPCAALGGAVGFAAGAKRGAEIGMGIGAILDGAMQMANAGKGRGGNRVANAEANRAARDAGLNKEGQRRLHDLISRKNYSLETIREIANQLAEHTKYLANPPR